MLGEMRKPFATDCFHYLHLKLRIRKETYGSSREDVLKIIREWFTAYVYLAG